MLVKHIHIFIIHFLTFCKNFKINLSSLSLTHVCAYKYPYIVFFFQTYADVKDKQHFSAHTHWNDSRFELMSSIVYEHIMVLALLEVTFLLNSYFFATTCYIQRVYKVYTLCIYVMYMNSVLE